MNKEDFARISCNSFFSTSSFNKQVQCRFFEDGTSKVPVQWIYYQSPIATNPVTDKLLIQLENIEIITEKETKVKITQDIHSITFTSTYKKIREQL